ncbi:MAG: hypothetical protein JWO91_2229 [Acidobacteriaceae bacterium]|nr:hypothetical protein [Acidobacteriaceae bacterium]
MCRKVCQYAIWRRDEDFEKAVSNLDSETMQQNEVALYNQSRNLRLYYTEHCSALASGQRCAPPDECELAAPAVEWEVP